MRTYESENNNQSLPVDRPPYSTIRLLIRSNVSMRNLVLALELINFFINSIQM